MQSENSDKVIGYVNIDPKYLTFNNNIRISKKQKNIESKFLLESISDLKKQLKDSLNVSSS